MLGTERHESRRIDNQLRGRSGRQGDPGESRFYLSLEDELMRLFATGAMNWVMGKALPDDVPIEAKMVTKAIERAQNTVEQRNAEIRKNVLKYDEVMNEQRKVIYKRRDQILDDADLREETLEYLAEVVEEHHRHLLRRRRSTRSGTSTASIAEIATLWPTELTDGAAQGDCVSTDELYDLLMGEATGYYEQPRGGARRRDHARDRAPGDAAASSTSTGASTSTRWTTSQEGIHLRAMGQKDPLVEWQREGFEMFGSMMESIARTS